MRLFPVCESRHSAVGMSTTLGAVPPSDRGSTAGRSNRLSLGQSIQTGNWGSPSHLFSRYYGLLPLRQTGRKANLLPEASLDAKNEWKYVSTSPNATIECIISTSLLHANGLHGLRLSNMRLSIT